MRYIYMLLLVTLGHSGLSAQTIPNLDMEMWEDKGGYMEPGGGVWATANAITQLSSSYPVTTTRTTDAHGGQYAAQIKTGSFTFFGVTTLVSGTLSTGEFRTNVTPPNNLLRGVPYTSRPARFKGWYKFTSVQGDSCAMYIWLHKWNGSSRDTIGFGGMFPDVSVPDWTEWDFTIDYTSQDLPDSVSIVFASSANGDNFQGQDGNTLIVDDMSIETATGIPVVLMPDVQVDVYPNPASERVTWQFERALSGCIVDVYDMTGKVVATVPVRGDVAMLNVTHLAGGNYAYVVRDERGLLVSGNMMIQPR